jgi:hypothetical protein
MLVTVCERIRADDVVKKKGWRFRGGSGGGVPWASFAGCGGTPGDVAAAGNGTSSRLGEVTFSSKLEAASGAS